MAGDMETEVEMLRRHRAEAWGSCGEAVGDSISYLYLSSVMTLSLFAAGSLGNQDWIWLAALVAWLSTGIVGPLLKSHFSKKYMRLANGE